MTQSRRIVVLDRATLAPEITIRRPQFAHDWVEYPSTAPDDIDSRVQDAHIVITNKVPLSAELLGRLPTLELIAIAATGHDIIDLDAARDAGVAVLNVRRYAEDSVPEHTMALLLALTRQMPAYSASIADGAWQRAGQFCYFDAPIRTLAGRTLGLVGYGSIAQRVARMAHAFDMRVVAATRSGEGGLSADGLARLTALDELLRVADVISLHCPLTAATRHLIDAANIGKMRPGVVIINTARGGLVDEPALAAAVVSGAVAGVGLDVLSVEPPPNDNPLLALAGMANVIITPHIAWAATGAMQRLADQLVESIDAFVTGQPRNLLT